MIGKADAHEGGVRGQGGFESARTDPPLAIDCKRYNLNRRGVGTEGFDGFQDRRVFDGRGHDTNGSCSPRLEHSMHGQIITLCSTAGKQYFRGFGSNQRRYVIAGRFQSLFGLTAGPMHA